jgi:serine/threonine-protein kinase
LTVGRRGGQDIVLPEATVSGNHGVMRWEAGTWVVEDAGSTNGTYADHSYDRKRQVALLHGGEVQLGECRVKLVNFAAGSVQHQRSRAYLERYDGLTGLLRRDRFVEAVDDECAFARWMSVPMCVAKYRIQGPGRSVTSRPTIPEMLAMRRVAQRVVELTEMMLFSIVSVVAGTTANLGFAVVMIGPSPSETRQVVEQVVAQVGGLLPESLELVSGVVQCQPGQTAVSLFDDER